VLSSTEPLKGGIKSKMRKLLKSRKALSPVVAAIILIAVTVAVSIAVAAWMGALTFTFMKTEELKIVGVEFPSANQIDVSVRNTGTASAVITDAKVGDEVIDVTDETLDPGAGTTISVTYTWANGTAYNVAVVTAAGNVFTYRAVAPTS